MTPRIIATTALATLLLAGTSMGEELLKSGPQVGQRNNRGGFYPQLVAGPGTGERRCPV